MRVPLLFLLTGLLLTSAGPAQAQTVSGLNLGIHLNSSAWENDVGDTDAGGGLSLEVGYGFTDVVVLYVEVAGARLSDEDFDDYTLGHADLGVRAHAFPSRQFKPYIEMAFTGRQVDYEGLFGNQRVNFSASGTGITFGIGAKYFFNNALALDVNLKGTGGSFDEAELNGRTTNIDPIDASSGRFNIGIVWHAGG